MGINEDAARLRAERLAQHKAPSALELYDQKRRDEAAAVSKLARQYGRWASDHGLTPDYRSGFFKRGWTLVRDTDWGGSGKSGVEMFLAVMENGDVITWNVSSGQAYRAVVEKVAAYGYDWPYDK